MTNTPGEQWEHSTNERGTATAMGLPRLLRYLAGRAAVLFVTLAVGIYVAIIIANLGGYIDDIHRADIDSALQGMFMQGWLNDVPEPERSEIIAQTRTAMEESFGLNRPFLLRCAGWLYEAITFQYIDAAVWKALPVTLLLFGTASLLLFFISLFIALGLSRSYGTLLDKLMVALAPLSSAPAWIYGIVLVMIFAVRLHWLPLSGLYDDMPPETKVGYIMVVARHMVLPVLSILLSTMFMLIYTWRTFFLLHSQDDYVEMAKAKGLAAREIERQYILRPSFPFIITTFSMIVIGFWQSSIVLEYFFQLPGIGPLFLQALSVRTYSPQQVISIMTIFAYLFTLIIYVLDMIYAVVDPRVRLGGQQQSDQPLQTEGWADRLLRSFQKGKSPRRAPAPAFQFNTYERYVPVRAPWRERWKRWWQGARVTLREFSRYPTAIGGLVIIFILVGISIYVLATQSRERMFDQWVKGDYTENPKYAQPAWVNLFRRDDLPETVIYDTRNGTAEKRVRTLSDGATETTISFAFDYQYDGFPQDLVVNAWTNSKEKNPFINLVWITPDGREIRLASDTFSTAYSIHIAQEKRLQRALRNSFPEKGLVADPASETEQVLKGRYELRLTGITFENDEEVNAKVILMGQVYGWAGTDHRRRDLSLPLLWGIPLALGLGIIGAASNSLITMVIAAIGTWFGGRLDALIQRINEINIILPILPIGVLVFFLYTKSIWVVIAVIVLISSLGSSIKNYRAAFLQIRQSPFIEAARSYGASDFRIIFRYMIPRIIPVLVPQLVIMIPSYVFLEVTLALLGVSDPYVPTWGLMIYDALFNGALQGRYYWILEPVTLLIITCTAFAFVGFALDRIFNPRLRTQ